MKFVEKFKRWQNTLFAGLAEAAWEMCCCLTLRRWKIEMEMSYFFSRIIDEPWRLVMMLEANPNRYWSYIQGTFFLLILPPAIGIVVSIIGYFRERKSPTGILSLWLPLMVFGAFFLLWGILWLQWLNTSYHDALHEAKISSTLNLAAPILAIHQTASVGAILWLFAGILFILSPMFKLLLNKTGSEGEIKVGSDSGENTEKLEINASQRTTIIIGISALILTFSFVFILWVITRPPTSIQLICAKCLGFLL